jgi:signal transduction histidine kinase/ActR/RegA family two-component response regulator
LQDITARQQAEEALQRAQAELEARVHERTAALRQANRALRTEIAERQRAEEERQRLTAQLQQAQKLEALGTLAGGIAHDFNNILSAILGYTELTLDEVPPESRAWHQLQHVLSAGQRAKDLVQQILTFSRQGSPARCALRLDRLVLEVLGLLRASLPSTIEIRTHLAPKVGTVRADPTQMHQVLLNLCTNAEHAMRETGGLLEIGVDTVEVDEGLVTSHPALHPGPHVRLTIRDTGHGMAPDVLARLFEPFFTTKGVGVGTGLGLSVVHGIMAAHQGAISVQSTVGQGTTFTLYLPCVQPSHVELPPAEALRHQGQGRILLVDDEAPLAHLAEAMLTRLGYEVVACTSSVEALEAFRAAPQQFDVVITDQTMPHLTGEQLARALRGIRPDIPIILCTGFSHVMDADKARVLGLAGFCRKPFGTRDLVHVLSQVVRNEEGGAIASS